MTCPACNGPQKLLGSLGPTRHYRCRNCGCQWSRTPEPRQASAADQVAAGRRLLAAWPADHPHRPALERRVAELEAAT